MWVCVYAHKYVRLCVCLSENVLMYVGKYTLNTFMTI